MTENTFHLAATGKALPQGKRWIFERKYDGWRVQIVADGVGGVRLVTRGGEDVSVRFAEITNAARQFPGELVLDGEVCAVDPAGRTNLAWLSQPARHGASLAFFAFDLLSAGGRDLRSSQLCERKQELATLLARRGGATIRNVDFVAEDGRELYLATREHGHEGIIAKDVSSAYRDRRTSQWLKFKHRQTDRFLAVGWQADAHGQLASLVLSAAVGVGSYRGRVGTGFTLAERFNLGQALSSCAKPSVIIEGLPQLRNVHWLPEPRPVAIEYLELSNAGILREPAFKAWS